MSYSLTLKINLNSPILATVTSLVSVVKHTDGVFDQQFKTIVSWY